MRIQSLLFFFLLTGLVSPLSAQWNVVQEIERPMSFGTRPGFRLEFANTEASTVETLWKNYVKTNFNAKLKKDKQSGEWISTGLKADMMGNDPFGIYSSIEKTNNDGAALTVWYDFGSYFLNRRDNPGRSETVASSLRDFYFDVRRGAIDKEIKVEEGKLKELETRQKRLERDNENLRKDIELYKAKIKKAEEDLVKNEKDQESNILDTDAQRRLIETVRRRLENVENERKD